MLTDTEIKNTIELMKKDENHFKNLAPEYQGNMILAKAAMDMDDRNWEHVSEELKTNRDFIHHAAKRNIHIIGKVPDKDLIIDLVLETPKYLRGAGEYRRDRDFVENVIKQNPEVFKYADFVHGDKRFIKKNIDFFKENPRLVKYMQFGMIDKEDLKGGNIEFLTRAIIQKPIYLNEIKDKETFMELTNTLGWRKRVNSVSVHMVNTSDVQEFDFINYTRNEDFIFEAAKAKKGIMDALTDQNLVFRFLEKDPTLFKNMNKLDKIEAILKEKPEYYEHLDENIKSIQSIKDSLPLVAKGKMMVMGAIDKMRNSLSNNNNEENKLKM